MTHGPLHVIFEDNHLLVVSKPAGLPTMGVEEGRESLLSVARKYIGLKYHKPGNVYLGVVSRLDSPVTGVVVFARTSKAARRLTELFRCRQVLKTYWALVDRAPIPPAGVLLDWVRKDERHQRMVSAPPETPDAQEARLRYRTVRSCPQAVLLEIQLETGRKHQIRLQLANRHVPILGDRKYGSRAAFEPGIALHARQLGLVHPVRKTRLDLVAPVPPSWHRYGLR